MCVCVFAFFYLLWFKDFNRDICVFVFTWGWCRSICIWWRAVEIHRSTFTNMSKIYLFETEKREFIFFSLTRRYPIRGARVRYIFFSMEFLISLKSNRNVGPPWAMWYGRKDGIRTEKYSMGSVRQNRSHATVGYGNADLNYDLQPAIVDE